MTDPRTPHSQYWVHFRKYWPSLVAVLFIVLLPFRRLAEVPFMVFGIACVVLVFLPRYRPLVSQAARLLLPIWLCFWIPLMLSSLDSFDAAKSWSQTAAALRFLPVSIGLAVVLRSPDARNLFLRLATIVLLFWSIDAFFQLALGRDLFGIPMHEDRLNGLFYQRYQFFGPTLAFLSPIVLYHTARRWPQLAHLAALVVVLGAVLISGMRAGWVAMVVVIGAFLIEQARRHSNVRSLLIVPVAAAATALLLTPASPLLKERLQETLLVGEGTHSAIDEALSYRMPIFGTAIKMYRRHPVNGVGVRAFPDAYPEYASEDDIHLRKNDGKFPGAHAHNIVLETMADTGTIGLIGLALGLLIALRKWRALIPELKEEALPYVVCLVAIVFPFNSHFAIFGVYTSSLIWFALGLIAATAMTPVKHLVYGPVHGRSAHRRTP